MFASILIIGFSLGLLVYWFRYSCLLVLRLKEEQLILAADSAVAPDSRFAFEQVRERLKVEEALDPLHIELDRDYKVLIYLLKHAAGLELGSVEDRLLVLDYKVMQCYYRITRVAAPRQARQALAEMATVLSVLARSMGEQAGVRSES
jgi:hypothetical protein